jgi:hypothetical protein
MQKNITSSYFTFCYYDNGGPGSSVGITTDYGLDGPESNPSGEEIFRPSKPAKGYTQTPVNGYRVFPGGKGCQGVGLTHPYLECRAPRKSRAIPLLTPRDFVAYKRVKTNLSV